MGDLYSQRWSVPHDPDLLWCLGDSVDISGVISFVNFARTNNLLVAVPGGSHNVAGNTVWDGGIMIHLSQMTSGHYG